MGFRKVMDLIGAWMDEIAKLGAGQRNISQYQSKHPQFPR